MNNLVHLSLRFFESKLINKNIFQKINEFKSLNYLELCEIELSENFFLKLSNLKNLQLIYCKNINIIDNINNENNNLTKLKCLGIVHCIMSKPESNLLLKCPEVESLNLSSFENEWEKFIEYNLILDFSSLKKIKKCVIDFNNFKKF